MAEVKFDWTTLLSLSNPREISTREITRVRNEVGIILISMRNKVSGSLEWVWADLSWDFTLCVIVSSEINPDMQLCLHTQDKLGTGLLELCREAVNQTDAKNIYYCVIGPARHFIDFYSAILQALLFVFTARELLILFKKLSVCNPETWNHIYEALY